MSRNAKIILVTLLVLATAISAFGVWSYWRRGQKFSGEPLRVLCDSNWLSEERLRDFSERHHVHIELFTYSQQSEFVRQMANASGKIDVVCTSSLFLRSLVRNQWLKRMNYTDLPNARALAADFLHLPYDRRAEYAVPLFWDLYVFFGSGKATSLSAKTTLQSRKAGVWGDELNLLDLLISFGNIKSEGRLEEDSDQQLRNDIRSILKNVAFVWPPTLVPDSPEGLLGKADWAEIPLSRAAAWVKPDSPFHFVLPEEGATLFTGLLAIGQKSTQPKLAQLLINDLLSSEHAMQVHGRLGAGIVHKTLDNVDTIPTWQRPQALRQLHLDRLRFPDLNIEAFLRFKSAYEEQSKSDREE